MPLHPRPSPQTQEVISGSGSDLDNDNQNLNENGEVMNTDALVVVHKRRQFYQKFKRRFPTYHKVRGKRLEGKEEHRPLTTIAESSRNNTNDKEGGNVYDGNIISPSLMNRLSGSKDKYIDPSHYPLEQITDAEYGRPYSVASRDNSPVDYDLKQEQRRFAVTTAVVILVTIFLLIIVVIAGAVVRSNQLTHLSDLETVCNITNILTKYGYSKCEEACSSEVPLPLPCEALTNSGGVENVENISQSSFTRAPKNIGWLCSDKSLTSELGFNKCQKACQKGECCFASGSFNNHTKDTPSCLESHQDGCKTYTPCKSIQWMKSSIDLVNQKCAPYNVHYFDGKQDCEEACKPRSCCFTKSRKENCMADNELWCDEYKACNVLYSTSLQDPGGTESVNSLCTNEKIRSITGREHCEMVCKQRSCCLSQDDNCRVNNEAWCDEFQACSILTSGSSVISGDVNSRLEKCADVFTLSSDDFESCKASCDYAICCSFPDMSCDGIDCIKYQYCNEIHGAKDGHDPGIDPLQRPITNEYNPSESKGSLTSPLGGEDGLQPGPSVSQVNYVCNSDGHLNSNKCYNLCSPYLCCFYDTYDPLSCHASKICAKYSACFILIDDDTPDVVTTPVEPSPSCAQLCSDADLKNGGNCDFDVLGSCICAQYASNCWMQCDASGTWYTGVCDSDGNDDGNDDSMTTTPIAPKPVEGYPADEMCSLENFSTMEGLHLCQALCKKHMCCFGGDEDCTTSDDCSVYQACGILIDDSFIKNGNRFNFDSICSLDSIATIGGKKACSNICEEYACCAAGDCKSMDLCDEVKACDNLQYSKKNEPINPTIPKCNQCPEDISDFSDNAECDYGKMSSCSCTYMENQFCFLECNTSGTWTMVCGRDPDLTIGFNSAPPPVELESFCSVELITAEDPFQLTKCLDYCKAAKCCKDKTCSDLVSFCNSYVSCYTVWEVDELKADPET